MTTEAAAAGTSVSPPQSATPRLPRKPRRWEAADSVIAGASVLVAVIVGIFTLLCVQGYYATIEATKERGLMASRIVAEDTRWVVSSALALLDGAAMALGNDAANADATTLAGFETISASIPSEFSLGVYDTTGALIGEASSPSVPQSISGTVHFDQLSQGEAWALTTQEANAETGAATFAVVRRLGTPASFAGAVLIAISAEVLETLASAQDLGEGSTISIVRNDGWVIARAPSLAAPLNLAGTPAFDNLTTSDSGSYISSTSPADGLARIVSYRHVDELGYIAVASISQESALAGLWDAIWIVSLLIAPIAIALLGGSFVTARLLRKSQSASRSLATALEHNEVLFREIHHRVKNNLQSVNALLHLQPIPRDVKADMSQRIAAMSAVHEHIYRANIFSRVQVKDYLHTLIENLRAGYDSNVEVVEDLTDVTVDADAATPLGLIVNEVVSNAFKHAFADGRRGRISIHLVAEGENRAILTVRDNGVGFDPETPAKGIGRRLIGGLTAQLQGESSHVSDADGSAFTLSFPLARA